MKYLYLLLFCINATMIGLQINEDELFSEDNLLSDVPLLTNESTRGVSFTGNIESQFSYSLHGDTLTNRSRHATNHFAYGIKGDILIDIRQEKGYKALANFGFLASSGGFPVLHSFIDPITMTSFSVIETNTFAIQVKEVFVDFPIANLLYFRFGKQFLTWGTTYFWNPTDLINREKKNLNNPDAPREGTWGIKLHIPYQTIFNWYTFVDMSSIKMLEEAALASRMETIVGNTEIGICGWWKKDKNAVYGIDISSRFFHFDIKAEGSLSYGDNRPVLKEEIIVIGITNYTSLKITNEWVYRAAINLSRSWEILDVKDRLHTMVEIFYNSRGTNDALFKNKSKFLTALASGSYIPHEYGRWYALFSISIQKFFLSTLSSRSYLLWNMDDYSAILNSSLTYTPLDAVNATFGISWCLGEEQREYTAVDYPLTLSLGIMMRF